MHGTGDRGGTIMEGLQGREQTALELGRSLRTIARWERMGMPVIRVGTLRLHDPVSVREWLRAQEQKQDAPRRGRRPGTKQDAPRRPGKRPG